MNAGWSLLAASVLGSGPYSYGPPTYSPGPATPPMSSFGDVTGSGVSGGYGDQLYTYEQQDPWLHGYFQEIPAYGGHHYFRPYNYKHVLSQSQTAAGFGMSPVMPYSQQFWHRYENRANLSPYMNEPGAIPPMPGGPGGMPLEFPGVGYGPTSMAAPPQATTPAPRTAEPGEWNAGPVIVPAKAEDRPSASADAKPRWGRWTRQAAE